MSKADRRLSLYRNGRRVMTDATTTSAVTTDPEIVSNQRKAEPLEDFELYLSSDDDRDADRVEEEKMIKVDSLMEIKRWVKVQKKYFTPNTTAPISEVGLRPSCRVVRYLDKLVVAVDDVIDVLDERRRRGFPKYEQRRAKRRKLRKATAVKVPKLIGGVHAKEKSRNSEHNAPSIPSPTVPASQGSLSDQSPTQSKSSLNRRPVFKSDDRRTTRSSTSSGSKGSKIHRCHTCRKTFVSKLKLTEHCFIHLNEEEKAVAKEGWRHGCYFCYKRFKRPSDLAYHLVIHVKEKGYRCDQCGKEFTENSKLTMHKRQHSANPQPFTCEECGKAFPQTENLFTHKKVVHRKLKDIDCPKCPMKFILKSNMVDHLNAIHLKIRPRCPHCAQSFAWKTSLWKHMKKFHPWNPVLLPNDNPTII